MSLRHLPNLWRPSADESLHHDGFGGAKSSRNSGRLSCGGFVLSADGSHRAACPSIWRGI